MDVVFQLGNLFTMPFWLLMMLAPLWLVTRRLMQSTLPVMALAALYAALVVPRIPALIGDLANPSVDAMAHLLGAPEGATIAWVHFLAFDLFVGRWIYLDSRKREFSPLLVGPILLLTLMFGPLGYLAYFLLGALGSRFNPGRRAARERLP